jgi:transketolase
MEGISAEAASLAGHLRLGKLLYLYDSNEVTLDGPASLTFTTEDVEKRYQAYGWQVLRVKDGDHDLNGIESAIAAARAETSRPSLIIVHTTIGYGSPNKQGTASAHGSPLGAEEVALTKKALGWDPDAQFHVPDKLSPGSGRRSRRARASKASGTSGSPSSSGGAGSPPNGNAASGELPSDWDAGLPRFKAGEKLATREASGKVLNAIAAAVPELIGGDADLSSSTKTTLEGMGSFDGQTGSGRNLHFGVREHAMGGVVNGMAYHEGVRGYCSTFSVFRTICGLRCDSRR